MFDTIEKLREKPDRTKKQIAFLIAFFVAGVIFVFWLGSIYPDFINKQVQDSKVESLTPSPTSNFTETFSTAFSDMKDQFSKIQEAISSFSTSPAYYSATTTETEKAQN